MANLFIERDADLVLSSGSLELQYWYNQIQEGKETHPCLFALKIINKSDRDLHDISVSYDIISPSASNVRFCDAQGNVLDDQDIRETHDELAAGAYQHFYGRYFKLVRDDGGVPDFRDVIQHGFNVSYKECKSVSVRLGFVPK